MPWGEGGARAKILGVADGYVVALVEADAGYQGTPHEHAHAEFFYLIDGDVTNQGTTMTAGDGYAAAAGSRHDEFPRRHAGPLPEHLQAVNCLPGTEQPPLAPNTANRPCEAPDTTGDPPSLKFRTSFTAVADIVHTFDQGVSDGDGPAGCGGGARGGPGED